MKKKVGTLNGKPIVQGDKNIVNSNEIYLDVNSDGKIDLQVRGSDSNETSELNSIIKDTGSSAINIGNIGYYPTNIFSNAIVIGSNDKNILYFLGSSAHFNDNKLATNGTISYGADYLAHYKNPIMYLYNSSSTTRLNKNCITLYKFDGADKQLLEDIVNKKNTLVLANFSYDVKYRKIIEYNNLKITTESITTTTNPLPVKCDEYIKVSYDLIDTDYGYPNFAFFVNSSKEVVYMIADSWMSYTFCNAVSITGDELKQAIRDNVNYFGYTINI